ncbi:MAG: hypothetical protein QOI73_3164 [Solirubrobacteraceae bacterium]|nr:hypothetical protein [Solirubrobacteraceae bacterium]
MPMGDFLVGVALLLAVLGATAAATTLVMRRRLAHLDALERLLAGATIATAILIGVHLVPLMLGVLARGSVLAAAAIAVGLALLVKPAGARDPSPGDEQAKLPPDSKAMRVIAAAGAGFAAAAALADLGRWGGDEIFGIDSLTFHLPNVGRWIQSGSLWQLDQFLPQLAHANYPNNGEVVLLATMLPWHNDFLVRAPIALCVLLSAIAVGALARELRAPPSACVLAGAAAIAIPAVGLSSIPKAMPDALLWWTFATGALFLLRHARSGRTSDLVLAGVALGVGCGTKWYGLSSIGAALVLWVAIRLWAARAAPERRRPILRDGAIAGALALLGIAPWLLRNLVLSHNPFFPVRIAPFGLTIFDAPPDKVLADAGPSIVDYIGDAKGMRQLAFEFYQGLGPVALFAALALVVAIVLARRCPRPLVLGAVAIELALVYVLTPSTALSLGGSPVLADANTRYAMPALLLALPVVAWLIGRLGGAWAAVLSAALALAVAAGSLDAYEIAGPRELVLAAIVIAIAAAAVGAVRRAWLRRRSTALLVACALFAGLAGARGVERRVNDTRYLGRDPAIDVVLRTAPGGKRIGLAGEWSLGELSPVWPSFGTRISNEVEFVGVMPDNGFLARYHDEARFQAALRRGRYDLLVVGRGITTAQETAEQRWAADAGWRTLFLSRRFRLLVPPA